MARGPKRPSSLIFEGSVAARYGVLRWFLASGFALCLLEASGCLIAFDHYAEGDACVAARDAGIQLSTAPDPVLRGCDAGPEPEPEPEASSGAAGTEDGP